jgi:hypothetical protein
MESVAVETYGTCSSLSLSIPRTSDSTAGAMVHVALLLLQLPLVLVPLKQWTLGTRIHPMTASSSSWPWSLCAIDTATHTTKHSSWWLLLVGKVHAKRYRFVHGYSRSHGYLPATTEFEFSICESRMRERVMAAVDQRHTKCPRHQDKRHTRFDPTIYTTVSSSVSSKCPQ